MNNQIGIHLIAELYHCDMSSLDNQELLLNTLIRAAEKAKCTILHSYAHQFEPQGVTAVVVVSESHLSFHSYPEFGYLALDIFTCGDNAMPYLALNYILRILRPSEYIFQEIKRGHVWPEKD